MNGVSSFVITFCTVCIVLGGLFILCPDGSVSKSVKYIFSLIFIVCIVGSVLNIEKISFEKPVLSDSSETSSEMMIAAAEYTYGCCLRKAKINFSEITVCTDILEDNSIIITKVIIFSNESKETINSVLGEIADNVEVEIINE